MRTTPWRKSMSLTMAEPLVPLFIGGRWTEFRGERTSPVYNPSTGKVIAQVPACGPAEVDSAVKAAAEALPAWAETPAVERARVLFRFWGKLQENIDELAKLVTREHGKTRAEARASVQRGVEMVE